MGPAEPTGADLRAAQAQTLVSEVLGRCPWLSAGSEAAVAALETAWRAGVSAFPGLDVSPEAMAEEVAVRLAPPRSPESLHLVELYLVAAVRARSTRALEVLDEAVREAAFAALTGDGATFRADAAQVVLSKLCVDGEKLATYSARAPLRAWLRAVVVRAAADLRRAAPASAPQALLWATSLQSSPELAVLKGEHRQAVEAAVAAAFAGLEVRLRNVLRLHFIEGVPLEDVARLYGVHRSSVCRWLSDARDRLARQTRQVLVERLNLGEASVESLLRAMPSEVSLRLASKA